jgi:prophage maintenance system killer protein
VIAEPLWFIDRYILPLHERLIREFGGLPGLRDVNLLESALRRPIDKWNYQKPVPDLAEQDEKYDVTYGIAAGTYSEIEVAEWIRFFMVKFDGGQL